MGACCFSVLLVERKNPGPWEMGNQFLDFRSNLTALVCLSRVLKTHTHEKFVMAE